MPEDGRRTSANEVDDHKKTLGSVLSALEEIKGVLGLGLVLVFTMVIGSTFFVPDRLAQVFAGILTAVFTTAISVFATYHSASSAAKQELTRYGLQAWRNLNSLDVKLREAYERGSFPKDMVQGWRLDVDLAKLAWRDISLREVFELQVRLEAETYELAREYKEKKEAAQNPQDRLMLEREEQLKLAKLVSSSFLPLRVPTDVTCPHCFSVQALHLGPNSGDTTTVSCGVCSKGFNAHRAPDGTAFSRKLGPGVTAPQAAISSGARLPARLARYIKPPSFGSSITAASEVFAAAADGRLKDWTEYRERMAERLQAKGLNPNESANVHGILMGLKLFRLHGPAGGIGLTVEAKDLLSSVEHGLASKLWAPTTAEEFSQLLYGSDGGRLPALRELLHVDGSKQKNAPPA